MATTVHETDLRYPVGRFDWDAPISEADHSLLIATIAETPGALRSSVSGMSRDQLETPYRPGGWTVKQVVHHVPDSHLNAYTRFKLALTEDEPTIKPYWRRGWRVRPLPGPSWRTRAGYRSRFRWSYSTRCICAG